jgi:hypothetical protein
MRRILGLVLVMAACGGDDGTGDGPQAGFWIPSQDFGWGCSSPVTQTSCLPPAYFSPLPDAAEIRGGGVVNWVGTIEHQGAVDGSCIAVPEAMERGVLRAEYTFCRVTVDDVLRDDRAAASVRWNVGTPDECGCSALFDYDGAE